MKKRIINFLYEELKSKNMDNWTYEKMSMYNFTFSVEKKTSINEKITFLNIYKEFLFDTDISINQVIKYIKLFLADKSSLKYDCFGIKTSSMKKWIRKNNLKHIFEYYARFGEIIPYNKTPVAYGLSNFTSEKNIEDYVEYLFHQGLINFFFMRNKICK